MKKPKPSTRAFERAAAPRPEKVVLRLYIAGSSDRSTRAIQNAKEICDEHLAGTYELDVVDLFKQPTLAKDDQILAVPTLIKKLPLPLRRFIGDLSDRDVVLVGLDLKKRKR
jgi:circadian clock protein KaiB